MQASELGILYLLSLLYIVLIAKACVMVKMYADAGGNITITVKFLLLRAPVLSGASQI